MVAVILTWDDPRRVELIHNHLGGPLTFPSAAAAEMWTWDNDSEIKTFVRIVYLDE